MNWKTRSFTAGLTLSSVLLGYAILPAGAQTAPSSSGSMMQHSGASNCDAMAKGDAMSGAMAQGDAMSGGAMAQGDAMKSPAGNAMSGGAMAQGDAMSGGTMASSAMASGAMGQCNTPSMATPNSTGSR